MLPFFVVLCVVLGFAFIATGAAPSTPARDRVLFFAVGVCLVLVGAGIAGIELIKGGFA